MQSNNQTPGFDSPGRMLFTMVIRGWISPKIAMMVYEHLPETEQQVFAQVFEEALRNLNEAVKPLHDAVIQYFTNLNVAMQPFAGELRHNISTLAEVIGMSNE